MKLVVREALLSFRRTPVLSALSVAAIAFSLFTTGLYALVAFNFSQALEGLLNASDALHGQSDRLKLVLVAPTCREILEITGLASSFQFFENIEDAVRSFL